MKKIILSFLVAVSAMLSVSEAMAYDIWYVNGSDGRMYVRSSTDPATGTGSPRTASQVADTFSFSPDNQYIVYPKGYSSTRCYRRSVSDTSTSQDGTQVTSQTCYQPTYSPDGQYIVYV